ncbi:isocitrate/isopropylmalate family dehydrogenase [Streptomyces ochraceiscleroticus]|uniref:Isocitrate/isopropylmalate family dehydrogenase n=1 Tax=Streptomyces ochraceiscleroticus TaxID=47761 RepID=A0ABW1MJS8_9ACTN|nr:isocitrate/isopropylmalate family dehydrogenase [Streptomyces ochraceiscleroticus]
MSKVAVFSGDDASPEVVEPTVRLVEAAGADVDWIRVPPDAVDDLTAVRAAVDAADATLFGAASGRSIPALQYLRWGRRTYANVRPVRTLPNTLRPLRDGARLDLVIVRENLEGLYAGVEGDLADTEGWGLTDRTGRPIAAGGPGAFAVQVVTRRWTAAVARIAFDLARQRAVESGRTGHVAIGTKHNVLPRTDGLFREVALEVAAGYPDVRVTSYLADDLARRLVASPAELDVVLLPNMYGDILSDAAAALVGGLGMAPSGCYGDDYAYFEPAHGTAPDIVGQGVINPTAQMLSAAMMLDYLGQPAAAARIDAAVGQVYRIGRALTRDQGGAALTAEFSNAVLEAL